MECVNCGIETFEFYYPSHRYLLVLDAYELPERTTDIMQYYDFFLENSHFQYYRICEDWDINTKGSRDVVKYLLGEGFIDDQEVFFKKGTDADKEACHKSYLKFLKHAGCFFEKGTESIQSTFGALWTFAAYEHYENWCPYRYDNGYTLLITYDMMVERFLGDQFRDTRKTTE